MSQLGDSKRAVNDFPYKAGQNAMQNVSVATQISSNLFRHNILLCKSAGSDDIVP